jgi:hypothetical protein
VARSWAAYILPVVVIGGGIALYLHKEGTPPPIAAPPVSAQPASIALLAGLAPVDGWVVDRIFVNQSHLGKPQLAIEFTKAGVGVTIWVARQENVPGPPSKTARYALTYGDKRPLGADVPQPVIDKLLAAVADLVRANEERAPIPDGL